MGARLRTEGPAGWLQGQGGSRRGKESLSRGAVHACYVSGSVPRWIVACMRRHTVGTTGTSMNDTGCNGACATATRVMSTARHLACSWCGLCRCCCSCGACCVQEEPPTTQSAHATLHRALLFLFGKCARALGHQYFSLPGLGVNTPSLQPRCHSDRDC